MKAGILAIALCAIASGCAYNVQPTTARAVNIYSSYENKIPGKYAIVLDESLRSVNRDVRPATYVCSAHSFPIALGDTLVISVKRTLDAVFEDALERPSMPSAEAMKRDGLSGAILVKLDDFAPRLSCQMGFWTGHCTASTDIAFGVNVRGPGGGLVSTGVAGSKTVDGDSGAACEAGANVLSESISRATRDALERMAERLANAQKLR
jgi:hypothetical protein